MSSSISLLGLLGTGLPVCMEENFRSCDGVQNGDRAECSWAWLLLEGFLRAQVQGEIMSFSSLLGIVMATVRVDEVMLFSPFLVIMMVKVVMMGAAGIY